jgi:molybdate transport system substrate-binding protein
MRLRKSAAVTALLIVWAVVGRSHAQQGDGTKAATPIGPGVVTVFAAASLTAALQAGASAFEHGHPGVKVQLNFAGSSTLVRQIQQGAPADVFASADEANMQKLVETGAIADAPQLFARNRLQIVVPAGNPERVRGLGGLTKPGLTIALCGPSVSCGRYAAEAFEKAGLTVPAASQELDVKAVVSKVAMGEADVGIVYATDVRAAGDTVEGVDIPESSNVTARYPIAVVKNAPNTAGAAAFVEFVLSPDGQRLLASFGFLPR